MFDTEIKSLNTYLQKLVEGKLWLKDHRLVSGSRCRHFIEPRIGMGSDKCVETFR